MDLRTSVYNGVSSVGSSVDYYWQSLKNRVVMNYYYYFPPKPQKMVFVMLDTSNPELEFVSDDLGNSVFIADDTD